MIDILPGMHTRALWRHSSILTFTFLLSACASAPQPAPSAPAAARVASTPVPAAASSSKDEDKRVLTDSATFGDLVRLAQELDSAGEAHSEAGCLLRGTNGLRLSADLSLAARPLPSAPERPAEAVLEQPGSISVMSTWGPVRGEVTDSVLLAFTTTRPDAVKLPAIALFVTRGGVLVRGAAPELRVQLSALSPDATGSLLASLPGPGMLYVTADRSLALRNVHALLRLIPNRYEVALAVALPKGTRLPEAAADTREGRCPEGLPEPAPGEAEGSLSESAARAAVSPLREAALSCALSAGGRALLGGRVTLAMRVGKEGRAREACVVEDAIGEPLLRRCLISAARDLSLPAPSPAGFADLHLPLQIALTGPAAQRATCD